MALPSFQQIANLVQANADDACEMAERIFTECIEVRSESDPSAYGDVFMALVHACTRNFAAWGCTLSGIGEDSMSLVEHLVLAALACRYRQLELEDRLTEESLRKTERDMWLFRKQFGSSDGKTASDEVLSGWADQYLELLRRMAIVVVEGLSEQMRHDAEFMSRLTNKYSAPRSVFMGSPNLGMYGDLEFWDVEEKDLEKVQRDLKERLPPGLRLEEDQMRLVWRVTAPQQERKASDTIVSIPRFVEAAAALVVSGYRCLSPWFESELAGSRDAEAGVGMQTVMKWVQADIAVDPSGMSRQITRYYVSTCLPLGTIEQGMRTARGSINAYPAIDLAERQLGLAMRNKLEQEASLHGAMAVRAWLLREFGGTPDVDPTPDFELAMKTPLPRLRLLASVWIAGVFSRYAMSTCRTKVFGTYVLLPHDVLVLQNRYATPPWKVRFVHGRVRLPIIVYCAAQWMVHRWRPPGRSKLCRVNRFNPHELEPVFESFPNMAMALWWWCTVVRKCHSSETETGAPLTGIVRLITGRGLE